ncbi:MAG: hypothetical protein KW793_01665 [Candidatus Doudnabacteria bacterium]|nr:hypothetical protein [Candidatus Doudnabacteria bacterium]
MFTKSEQGKGIIEQTFPEQLPTQAGGGPMCVDPGKLGTKEVVPSQIPVRNPSLDQGVKNPAQACSSVPQEVSPSKAT